MTRTPSSSLTPQFASRLIQSIPEGVVVLDGDGRVTYLNPGAEHITGRAAAVILGKDVEHLLPPAAGPGNWCEAFVQGEKPRLVAVLDPLGRELTLSVTRTLLDPARGEKAGMVLVLRDATEENAVHRLRSHFLADISHEFRTPLSALKASVELLLEAIEDLSREETIELVKSLHFSVTGLQTLIDNLLESVSIEAGRFQIRKRPTDLETVAQEAGKVMQPLLERRRQTLSMQIQPGLPRAEVDPMRLNQVLVNLISNASKYGPLDRPIRLEMRLLEAGVVRFSVSDQGTGIPAQDRENIFRRFVRLEDEKDKAQYGVGLGLSVVKAIVESHGGQVGLDERSGGGNIFWFTLPVGED